MIDIDPVLEIDQRVQRLKAEGLSFREVVERLRRGDETFPPGFVQQLAWMYGIGEPDTIGDDGPHPTLDEVLARHGPQ